MKDYSVVEKCDELITLHEEFKDLRHRGVLFEVSLRGVYVNHDVLKEPGEELGKVLALQERFADLYDNSGLISLNLLDIHVDLEFLKAIPGETKTEFKPGSFYPYSHSKEFRGVLFCALSEVNLEQKKE